MRLNQEDRPEVFDLLPPEVEKEVQKLAKRTFKDVITVILLIKNSIITPLLIKR